MKCRSSSKVKVIGQRSISPGQKRFSGSPIVDEGRRCPESNWRIWLYRYNAGCFQSGCGFFCDSLCGFLMSTEPIPSGDWIVTKVPRTGTCNAFPIYQFHYYQVWVCIRGHIFSALWPSTPYSLNHFWLAPYLFFFFSFFFMLKKSFSCSLLPCLF